MIEKLLGSQSRAIVLVALAMALAGIVAALALPIGLFPQVSFPRVVVDLDAGSRPADQTALTVTRPVEEAIRAIPGVQNVRSETSRGSAQISVDFGWGRDMIASTLLVDTAVGRVVPTLPAGTQYDVRRMDPTVFPIISYALVSDKVDPVTLQDFARYQITPLLSSISGLARIGVQGGDTAEVQVLADPHRLADYNLSMTDLSTAIKNGNVLSAVGQVQDRGRLSLVIADRSVSSAAQIGDIVVKATPTGVVRVRDVATVQNGALPVWQRIVEDGKPAVLFNIYEQPDGNAVKIAQEVEQKLNGLKLPPGVKLVNWYDQSQLVTQSVSSVRDAVLIGLVLAGLVLLWFLRSWRVTLVAVIVVPATLAITVLVLSMLGMSFNIMTLGGIAAAVGLLIDDVIVMVEHIARRAGARDADGKLAGDAAVMPAAREFMTPLTGSSMATLIVFLPLSFLTGVTGAFSKALSVTMAAALAISWAMTAFVVPILARRLVDFNKWHDPGAAGEGRLAHVHDGALDRLSARPWLLAVIAVPLLVIGYVGYSNVPTGFMPKVDEGGFVMDYRTPAGTSLDETGRQVGQIDAMLRANPEVATFSRRLGTGLGGDLGQSYHGDYFVRLKPDHSRPTEEIAAAVADEIAVKVPGVQVEVAQLIEDLIGDLTAVPQPIEVKLYASDPSILEGEAQKVAATISKISGVVEVNDGVQLAGDALNVHVDPVRAGMEGVVPADVESQLSTALTGAVATTLAQPNKAVDVRVRLPDAMTMSEAGLAQLPIRATDGHVFPLSRVATIEPVTGQPQIGRENLEPMIAVTGRIQGRGIGAAVADVTTALDKPGALSPGVRYELGGLYQQQQIAFSGLIKVFAAALIAELVLLLVLYRRFWLPVIIIGCSLLSTTSVFTALWLAGVDLNITALMGMTMIIGIGTEMAIFYVSEFEELAHTMPPEQATREASRNRLRPITMTTLAAILTLLPLAFAIGQGSGIQQPLAIAIIAGLLLQYPLVLLAMPVLVRLTLPKTA
ncbi:MULTISPECIES: efflux RND transporter permease subunit [Alphaproteobacteria]|jgi:multidrug efflux pump subunit AcrB|uniref:Efflux RND transporter permease subunit n=1 Tax=Sphingobium soli TaxID=1591116 RepID=A0ABS8H7L9_9SPHN|nr:MULTISPECIES: efflux RND transporter permease subunit [Alphaproteobacteria]MAP44988.1 transporter [Sphingobium sp.]MEE2740114.1 efflux RND transporter permease subunit [Pseudomonadota bacterium]MAX16068.1 transporter [Sphingobium sp.]MBS46747.1 transporter [Sphingobium sp.]MCC4234038.1 efflux RND transporter permease subunit [Sphingobium soli]|tara:strand:- start:21562 stop:24600 length:3039 start_codon:yes stop_codon:yes gene_type:complete